MITTACLRITCEQIAFSIDLPSQLKIRLERVGIIIRIDEVLASIVRRVDINQLHPPEIWLEQKLENFQIVAFDEYVAGLIEIDGLVSRRNEGPAAWRLQQADRIILACPGEVKTAGSRLRRRAQRRAQPVEINLALNEDLRKEPPQARDLRVDNIAGSGRY